MSETIQTFEQRKRDHIRLALNDSTEAAGFSGLDRIQLHHEALPDLNFDDITLTSLQLGAQVPTPFLVSSMTAGHEDALMINERLMCAAQSQGWAMGIGSQRRELFDKNAHKEWLNLRQKFPQLRLFGNVGISQVITAGISELQRLVDNIEANALQIHLNPLQECLQSEGTPHFKGAYQAIEDACSKLNVPIIIKETGCGFSTGTLKRLNNSGIAALDISGFGGTHWGRIEGLRASDTQRANAAQAFKAWGISTLDSLLNAQGLDLSYEIWGSGGVRTGLDAAKLLALGATTVGYAKPLLQAALESTQHVIEFMQQMEFELTIALFCTGSHSIRALQETYHAMC